MQPSLLLSNVSLAACRTLDKCLIPERWWLLVLRYLIRLMASFCPHGMGLVTVDFPAGGTGSASALRRVPAQPTRAGTPPRGGASAARPAPRSRRSACPRTPGSLRAPTAPEISHGPGGPTITCLLHGRQESARNDALPGSARSHADSTPSVMRGKGGTFFLVSRLRVSSRSRPGPTALRVSSTQRSDPNRCAARLLLYLAAVLAPNPGFGFSNYASDVWSYGDSNPRPFACLNHRHVHGRRHTLRQQRKRLLTRAEPDSG
jgi:hypothetical protein